MSTTLAYKEQYEQWDKKDIFPIVQEEIESELLTRLICGTPDKKSLIIEHTTSKMFADKLNKGIYELACRYAKDHGIDKLNAYNLILSLKDKTVYFGRYIKGLADCFTCSADTKNYVLMLQIAYKRRMSVLCKSMFDYQQLENELEQSRIKDTELKLANVAAEYLLDYDDKANSIVKTGFPSLDKLIGGLLGGTLMLIAASTAMGKTVFVLNTILNIAKQNKKILFFSLEMTTDELLGRIVAAKAGINSEHLRNRSMTDNELDRFAQYTDSEDFKNLQKNISIHSEYDVTIDNIATTVRKSKADIIFLDYLGLLKGGSGSNRYEKVSEISRNLKILANEVNKPFVVLHQLNRDLKGRADKRPILSDIRDSGQLEQDFDIVSFLYRPAYFDPNQDKRHFEVIIGKSRHSGGMGKIAHLIFDGEHQRITDPQGETQKEIKQCSMKY